MNKSLLAVFLLAGTFLLSAQPVELTIETAAGIAGVGDGRAAPQVLLFDPQAIVFDSNGNMFVADRSHNRIRRIGIVATTIAGTGIPGSSGDGGQAQAARLDSPSDVAVDGEGNIYIADTNNHKVRKVSSSGEITTVAGTGSAGSTGDGGPAVDAELGRIEGITRDAAGNLYIADTSNHRIRKVDKAGEITTVAGTGTPGFSGDGGPATEAQLDSPVGVAVGRAGTLLAGAVLFADFGNHRVRAIIDGEVTTVAGNGVIGFGGDGGQATSAELGHPRRIGLDQGGSLLVTQWSGHRVRRINASGVISTVAGAGFGLEGDGGPAIEALMRSPEGIAAGTSGTFFVSDAGNHRVRRVAVGKINTFAGRSHHAGDGGPGTEARVFMPYGIETDAQANLYVADALNFRVRKLTFSGLDVSKGAPVSTITTIAGTGAGGFSGDGGEGSAAELGEPRDVAIDSEGSVYIADRVNHRIRRLAANGVITTYAGNGSQGFSGDGGAATQASLNNPSAVAVDSQRNVFVADTGNERIRRITPQGTITTVVGTGVAGFGGDGGAATQAQIDSPTGIEVDGLGNVFISDTSNRRVRMVSAGGFITTVAGNGEMSDGGGDGGLATEAGIEPWDIAVDGEGDLFIADGLALVRKVMNPSGAGIITTAAGNGVPGFEGDGLKPTEARMHQPRGVAVDVLGTLYISDSANNLIRAVLSESPGSPLITTEGVVDAAGFGPRVAPDSIATAFVLNGGGGRLEIIDNDGVAREPDVFFNDGRQINFYVDPSTALGPAEITLRRSDVASSAEITISNTGAGIFFASGFGGQAVALAQYLRISNGVGFPLQFTFDPADFSLVPIDLGPAGDQVFLVLYCTGLRRAASIQVTIAGAPVPLFASVPAPGFDGLDQLNVGPIPRSFVNAGAVKVQLIVDGVVTNIADVSFD
jgi:hypothetical protein